MTVRDLYRSLWFRLLLGFFLPLPLFLGAALVASVTIQRLISALDREQQTQEVLRKAYEVKEGVSGMAALKWGHHLVQDEELLDEEALARRLVAQLAERQQGVRAALDELRGSLAGDRESRERLAEVADLEERWYRSAREDVALVVKALNQRDLNFLAKLQVQQEIRVLDRIRAGLDRLIAAQTSRLGQRREEARDASRDNVLAIGVAIVFALGFSMAVTHFLYSGITRPVLQLRDAVHRMRQGRFEAVQPHGPKEIAELMSGFNLMGLALVERTSLLESRELRYRTIVGTTSNLLWTTDSQGRNNDMGGWCSFTGQDPGDGGDWLEAIHPDDREGFVRDWQEGLREKVYFETECRIRRADGEYRNFACRNVPVFETDGSILEWVRICVDVTDRKREERLRQEKEAAEAANLAKSKFLAKMSHELRTPLNAVIGMSKMLRTQRFGPLNEKQLDYLTDITNAGEHLLALINDILDLSKVEAESIEFSYEPFSVARTAEQVLSTVRTLVAEKGLTVRAELPDPGLSMTGDFNRVKQILYNLISNAVKFTPAGGRVSLRCYPVAGPRRGAAVADAPAARAVRVDVEDDGIGIPPEDHASVGTEFFQVQSDPRKPRQGAGLGLALTKRLVELMGGEFWFVSAPGEGSCFSFALPLAPPQGRAPRLGRLSEPPRVMPAGPGGVVPPRPLALVIEDHPATNKLLCDWLADAGIEVESARDGGSGLAKARALRPQIILLDIRLPGLNGVQVIRELRADAELGRIPVVVVSVLEDRRELGDLDVLDWFVKPLDKEHFLDRLRERVPALFLDGTSVLVVDDDPRARKWMGDLLAASGAAVREAADATAALEAIEAAPPGLVLVDLMMPGVDGFQLVRAIRDRPEWDHIPIIVVTGKDPTAEERARLEKGIQGILSKQALTRDDFRERLQELGLGPGGG